MPRLARLEAPGTLHHVTMCRIEERKVVVATPAIANALKRAGSK